MILDPANPAHRAVLQASRAWGVPVSEFLGYGKRVTEHEHSGTGQLVRSTEYSRWTDDDRDNALALLEYEDGLCPGCGDELAVTSIEANEFRYVALAPVRCHRCTAASQQARAEDRPHPAALSYPVELRQPEVPLEADLQP